MRCISRSAGFFNPFLNFTLLEDTVSLEQSSLQVCPAIQYNHVHVDYILDKWHCVCVGGCAPMCIQVPMEVGDSLIKR